MKNIPTIHELRSKGYKVRVTHVRKFYRFDPETGRKRTFWAAFLSKKGTPLATPKDVDESEEFFISIKGGETIIEIADKDGKELGRGIAKCSEEDPYVKSIGIKKATALALADARRYKDAYYNIRQLFFLK